MLCAGHKSGVVISWPIRLKIALGVAHGLHYLHALAQPRIIHRDIKANNILLDKDFNPKIADFGLALLFPDEQSHMTMANVAGTRWVTWKWDTNVDLFECNYICLKVTNFLFQFKHTETIPQCHMFVFLLLWSSMPYVCFFYFGF